MIDDDFEWFVDRAIEKGVAGAVIFSVDPYEFREFVRRIMVSNTRQFSILNMTSARSRRPNLARYAHK